MRTIDFSRPPTGPFALNRDCPQAQGILGWWPMGAASGAKLVFDHVGKAHLAGTTSPMTLGPSGAPNCVFNGSSDVLTAATAPVTAMPLTLACWATAGSASLVGSILSLDAGLAAFGSANFYRLVVVGSASPKQVRANQGNSGSEAQATYGAGWVAGREFHVAGVFSGVASRDVYYNGALGASDTTNLTAPTVSQAVLGRHSVTGSEQYWSGNLGEAGVWGIALPAHIIARLYDPSTRFELWYPLRSPRWISMGGATAKTAATSLNAAIQLANSLTAGMSAGVQAQATASATVNGAVQQAHAAQATLDAAVQLALSASATLQGAVQQDRTAVASIDAALQVARTAGAALDLAVQAQGSSTASLSAQVQAAASLTAAVDAYVQAGSSVLTALSAAVLQQGLEAAAALDAAVQLPRSGTVGMTAALQVASSATALLQAAVQVVGTASASLSAQVQSGTSTSMGLEAAVQAAAAATASVQAAIAQAASTSLALGAAVSLQLSLAAAMDAATLERRTALATLSAYVNDPAGAVFYPPDPDRTLRIRAEDRTLRIRAEDRILRIR